MSYEVIVDKRRNSIQAVIDVKGYFKVHGYGVIRNKFTRNMGYAIDGLLRRANVTVYDRGGSIRTLVTAYGGLNTSINTGTEMGTPFFIAFGTGTREPTVVDNDLATLTDWLNVSIFDIVDDADKTSIVIAGRWAPTTNKTLYEVGILLEYDTGGHNKTLLARTVIPQGIIRSAYTIYIDGYMLTFPVPFTRWFVRALFASMMGLRCVQWMSLPVRDSSGNWVSVRSADTFAGGVDVAIGSNNSPASPEHYNLLNPIASLSNQSQTVEVDTAFQEVRIIRHGIYTPSTNVTLGEIGLFTNIYAYIDTTVATRRILVARVPLDTPITLSAGTTYTIGIVLRFA
jgi:hypothetical protein